MMMRKMSFSVVGGMLLGGLLASQAIAGDLDSYSYTPNFLSRGEQALVNERWKAMDMQAARSRLLIEQAESACNIGAYHMELDSLKSQLETMLDVLQRDDPKKAQAMEAIFLHTQEVKPVEEASGLPEADILQFHAYFYNRFLNESKSLSQRCTGSIPAKTVQKPTMTEEQLQQETLKAVDDVHKMTTYMDDVVPLVKKCQQTQYNTYMDPLEQLSERLLLLRKNAQYYAGHSQDDSIYGLVDKLFDEVVRMRGQMETAWQQGHCMQAAIPSQ